MHIFDKRHHSISYSCQLVEKKKLGTFAHLVSGLHELNRKVSPRFSFLFILSIIKIQHIRTEYRQDE